MNFETLRQYLEEAHGRPCVWEHQDAPEPERPFLSMAVLGIETIGKDWHGSADADGIMEMIGQREATIGIYANPAHRADPNESQRVMLEIVRGLNMPSTIWLLQLAGLARRGGPLSTISSPSHHHSQWRPRANCELRLGFHVRYTDDVGIVETIDGYIHEQQTGVSTPIHGG